MKKLTLFFAFACILLGMKANGTQIAAGNIRVEAIVFNDFDIFAEFYTNCAGDPPPLTISMCADDLMNPGNSFTITLYRDSTYFEPDTNSGKPVPIGWGLDSTQCDDPSSTIPGYRRWSYYNLATLPKSIWRLSTYFDTLETTNNIIAPSPFYTECTMDMWNNFAGSANSSVYIPQPKVFYVPEGAPYTLNLDGYNFSASADSFYFEIDTVITATGACDAPAIAPFQTASPAYSIPQNPFQTGNSLTLSQTVIKYDDGTATLNFTPTQEGSYLFGVRTNALRVTGHGGVWRQLNAARHWFRIVVLPSSNPPVTCDTFDGGTLDCFDNCVALGNKVLGMYNWPMSFCYKAQSADTNVRYIVTDDRASSLPTASISYSGQGTDTVVGTLNWTPNTYADTGWHTILFDVVDTACATPTHYTDTVHIYIPGFLNVNTTEQQEVKLFPNPNNGYFTVTNFTGNVEVLNAVGQVVYKGTLTKHIQLPADLPNGRYILKAYKGKVPLIIPFVLSR